MSSAVLVRPAPFVRRVRVRNYRSIAECDVTLGPLTVLVGFNASGKSNFLDVLRFVKEALEQPVTQVVAARGGLDALLHRTASVRADSFDIQLDLMLRPVRAGGDPVEVSYGFTIGRDPTGRGPLVVFREYVEINGTTEPVRHSFGSGERPVSRLLLPLMVLSDDEPQALLELGLRAMRFYDLDSVVLGAPADRVPGPAVLGAHGEHLGQVLGEMRHGDLAGKERFDAYLAALVPNLVSVDERREGRFSTVEARFHTGARSGDDLVEAFQREALSEGTMRAAGVLAALLQPSAFAQEIPLIGMEEPETALNPTYLGALYEALHDASLRTQIVVTSQSPDLLDSEYASLTHLRAVANVDGATRIGAVGSAGLAAVEQGLMTISELHRSGLLEPWHHGPGGSAAGEGAIRR